MKFNELAQKIIDANNICSTTDIKGKDYVMVNQRVKAFRMVYPDGRIETEIVSLNNGTVTFKATVYDGTGNFLANGYAQEKESSSFINKTSFIENCETSAIGRALGFCGFGIDSSIASYEEVANAMKNQGKDVTSNADVQDKKEMVLNDILNIYKQYPNSSIIKKYLKIAMEQANVSKVSDIDEKRLIALKTLLDNSMNQIKQEMEEENEQIN